MHKIKFSAPDRNGDSPGKDHDKEIMKVTSKHGL